MELLVFFKITAGGSIGENRVICVRRKMKRITFIIAICLLFIKIMTPAKGYAVPLDLTGVAQILCPNDAQGIALGITGVAFREGLFAGYTNPAGLTFKKYSIGFSHIPSRGVDFPNTFNQEAICLGIPVKGGFSISALFYNLNFGDVTVYYIGYSFDFTNNTGSQIEGLTYGLGVTTPKSIKLGYPIYLSFEYGRGLPDYRDLDTNIISISVILDKQ